MTRLLVISRTRTNLDVAELIRTYEFSVVPHALFDCRGNLLKCSDKADFFNGIIDHTGVSTDKEVHPCQDIVVIDGITEIISDHSYFFPSWLSITGYHKFIFISGQGRASGEHS